MIDRVRIPRESASRSLTSSPPTCAQQQLLGDIQNGKKEKRLIESPSSYPSPRHLFNSFLVALLQHILEGSIYMQWVSLFSPLKILLG